MPAQRSQQLRRDNLFLVRAWPGDSGDETGSDKNGSSSVEWSGTVQRVVDGESHRFDGWQNLREILDAMLSGHTPKSAPSTSEDDNSQLFNL